MNNGLKNRVLFSKKPHFFGRCAVFLSPFSVFFPRIRGPRAETARQGQHPVRRAVKLILCKPTASCTHRLECRPCAKAAWKRRALCICIGKTGNAIRGILLDRPENRILFFINLVISVGGVKHKNQQGKENAVADDFRQIGEKDNQERRRII